jgi:hypothetical protein
MPTVIFIQYRRFLSVMYRDSGVEYTWKATEMQRAAAITAQQHTRKKRR